MANRLRIAFVKDWYDDPEHLAGNKDGILAAIDELGKRHHVRFYSRHNVVNGAILASLHEDGPFDALLCWGSLDRPWHAELPTGIPALLCFAGGLVEHPNLKNFRHIFCESQIYLDLFTQMGISCSRAFGTNTRAFWHEPRTPKILDALYPASFCRHKDQEVFARAMGSRGLCVGQFNDLDIVGKCLQLNTPVLGRVSSATLNNLYNMARTTVIPCGPHGGSQRTVIESMACGTPVILASDNDRCREFVQESGFGKLVDPIPELIKEAVYNLLENPIDPQVGISYVRSKWTEIHYADALERGILECLTKHS